MSLTIAPAQSKRETRIFLDVPDRIYQGDPYWIKPLYVERLEALNRKKEPYYRHAEMQQWIAYRDTVPVGRISAQVDDVARARIDPHIGHFGFFECEDNPETAKALFETAETWLKARDTRQITGPFSPSINTETGLLIDGFNTPPRLLMPHGRPYYDGLVREVGYEKARDIYALDLDLIPPWPDKVMRLVAAAKKNPRIDIRMVDMKHLERDVAIVFDIFNDAWSDNWGFVPLTDDELSHAAGQMKQLLSPERCQICSYDGEPAAFMLALTDINHLIGDLDGRLLPFGWAKLLYRLKSRYPEQVRVPLMGVRKKYQGRPSAAMLAFLAISEIRRMAVDRGCKRAELGWLLEDNTAINSLLEPLNAKRYKTYRIYQKAL